MILLIDCYKLVKGQGKSIGIYNHARNVVINLAAENRRQKRIDQIILLGNEKNRDDFAVDGVSFVSVPNQSSGRVHAVLWELFLVKKYIRKYQADRVLFPRGYAPLFFKGKATIIIHDLIPFYYDEHFPGVFPRLENFYIMNRLKASIKSAERVITISEYSKEEIIRRLPSAKEKITVIYNGYNRLGDSERKAGIKKEDYIVAMTSGLPHKNARGILKAYQEYASTVKAPLPIKIVGISGTEAYDIGETAKLVTCYPYVKDDKELSELIAGGRLFLFLSLIEGFGFPPLEAMDLRVPVICSDRTSLPEVTGEAALQVDPENPKAVAAKMEELLSDGQLQKELIGKGICNCERFSWDKIVKQYMEELTC